MSVLICKAAKTALRSPLSSTGTTVKLEDLKDHKGNLLSLANFGAWFVLVLKNGTSIEMIKCDALSQVAAGADCTVASSGRHLNGTSPFAGSSTGLDFQTAEVIVTNDPYTVSQFANLNNDNTFTGVNIFPAATPPKTDGTVTYAAGSEKWVVTYEKLVATALASAVAASTTSAGYVEEATLAEAIAGTATGGTGARLFVTPDNLQAILQGQGAVYLVEDGTGADDTYTTTATPTLTAYTTGQLFRVKLTVANTAAATLNVNSLGAKAIKKYVTGAKADIETGDIVANYVGLLEYDGTDFVLLSMTATTPTTALLSEMAAILGSTDISGAELEDLSDGGTTTIHYHPRASMVATRDLTAATGSVSHAHGLAAAPKWVEITAYLNTAAGGVGQIAFSTGTWLTGGTYACAAAGGYVSGAWALDAQTSTSVIVYLTLGGDATNDNQQATVTVDATNVTLNWTKNNTPVGTAVLLIKCGF